MDNYSTSTAVSGILDVPGSPFKTIKLFPPAAVDVFLLVDLSGSFSDDLPIFKAQAPGVISTLKASNPNIRFGLGSFEDYPIFPFGSAAAGDVAYRRNINLTFDTMAVQAVINGLFTRFGADGPQSQLPALYQAATGAGQDLSGVGFPGASIPAGQQANFRDGAVKLFLLWTDASFHNPGDPGSILYPGPSFSQVIDAILTLDPPMVIGISSGGGGIAELRRIAEATGALAPAGGVDCNGDGTIDIPEGEPLVCTIASSGTGIGEAIVVITEAAVEAANQPPTADANGPYEGNEGSPITIDASGSSDPDPGDTLTYSFDCTDDGTFEVVDQPDSTFDCTYGDNGSFTVRVRVKDSGGLTDEATAEVTVNNVVPSATLDTATAITFAGGDAFLGRKEVEQTHQASATDPGSDDLMFSWFFGSIATYFNNGVGPDPFPSPGGTFPFSATDTASFTPTTAGVHLIEVKVIDDDLNGDEDRVFARLPKLVTDNQDCTKSQGFWKHQFSKKGKKDDDGNGKRIDDATLLAYLDIVNFASAVFSENTAASTLAEGRAVFNADGDDDGGDTADKRTKATRQALAAWLNFAQGAVGWEEPVTIKGDDDDDDDNDGPPVMLSFHEVMAQVEAILLNPNAKHKELVKAKDFAEAVNEHDEDNPACDDDKDGDKDAEADKEENQGNDAASKEKDD